MAQAASKTDELLQEVEPSNALTPFRAHQIVAECRALLAKVNSEQAAGVYMVIGLASMRLGNSSKAIEAFQAAKKLGRHEPGVVSVNLGAALLGEGRLFDAIDGLAAMASESQGTQRVLGFANLAEGLSRVGQQEDAEASFREAVSAADFKNASHLFALAMQAAEVGLDDEALRFFMSFVGLLKGVEVIDVRSLRRAIGDAHLRSLLEERPVLKRVVDLATTPATHLVAGENTADSPDVDRVFSETCGSRARANEAVLAERR